MSNEFVQKNPAARKSDTIRLVKMGALVALSVVLVYLIHFPIFPAVPFLEYDPADIPILIGTFTFGPVTGMILTIVTSVIQADNCYLCNSGDNRQCRKRTVWYFDAHYSDKYACDDCGGRLSAQKDEKDSNAWPLLRDCCNGRCDGCCKSFDYSAVYGSPEGSGMESDAVYHWF